MPQLNQDQLQQLGERILNAAGVPADFSQIVAHELCIANMVGHDSHGVMRLMQYVDYIDKQLIVPTAKSEVVRDEAAFGVVDGHLGFGQVTANLAVDLGIAKARKNTTATMFLRNCNHVGRLGSYAQRIADAGMACMMGVNAPGPGAVAPFGGIDRKLGTNPIAMAAPHPQGAIVLDMTTSASAEGKLRVALQKGEQVPAGWIIDSEGRPSVEPADFYGPPAGALLPLGGPLGFKGYGLSVMVDVFCGILSGSGVCQPEVPPGSNGMWMYLLAVDRIVDKSYYTELITRYTEHLKASRQAPDVSEILLPGEIESRRHEQRAEQGVPIPAETWRQLEELATKLGTGIADLQG